MAYGVAYYGIASLWLGSIRRETQLVSNPSDRLNEGLSLSHEFGPESPNVYIYRSNAAVVIIPPHAVKERFPSQYPSGRGAQASEQFILFEGQAYGISFHSDLIPGMVYGDLTDPDHLRSPRAFGSPEKKPYSGIEFPRPVRLDEKVVYAERGIEQRDVLLSENQERGYLAGFGMAFERLAHPA